MVMMKCPKCGFEQPKDQFCAKCGVNVSSFKPTVPLSTGLKSFIKPILFVVVVLGAIVFIFRNMNTDLIKTIPEEIEVEESTQLGYNAGSLKSAARTAPTGRQVVADKINVQTSRITNPETIPAADAPRAKFNQVQVSFAVGEENLEQFEAHDKNWHLVPQANPIFSSNPEDVTLKTGNNTFEYADDLIAYDLNFFIEEITDKDVKVKINVKRTMRAPAQDGAPTATYTLNEKIPLDQTLIIIDALPRRASIDRPNSILSTLYKSQLFLSRASEFVQIIKFENPSNSPQE